MVAGLDLPAKLRRSLGRGRALSPEELAERLRPADQDGDGRLTRGELQQFLLVSGAGGPWFSEMLAGSIWKRSQAAFEREVPTLSIAVLARVLHTLLARSERPTRRYVITPEAVRGEAPRLDPSNRPVDEPFEDMKASAAHREVSGRAPSSPRGPDGLRPPSPRVPRAPSSGPAVPRSMAPGSGRGAAPGPGRVPIAGRPESSLRASGRPAGRGAPRRPSGRPRS